MPCYNSEEYVKNAIESLLNQSYSNWELIAVNDGSKDSTLDILNHFATTDSRIKVFSKRNGGYATAVNLGLKKVSGDYFLMMGSDDMLSENLFDNLAKLICAEKSFPDIVAFRAVKIKNGLFFERDQISNFDSCAALFDTSIAEFEKRYPQHAKILSVRDTAKCYKTSRLNNLRYFGKFGFDADGVFATLFTHKCHSFLCVPTDGYLWTIRENSVSAKVTPKINIDRLTVWRKYLSTISQDKAIELSSQEKKYILYPFTLSINRLKKDKRPSIKEWVLMHLAIRRSVKVAKKKKINLSYYEEIFDPNPIKRALFLAFPLLWLLRHGFVYE